jgi:hypothetical protein
LEEHPQAHQVYQTFIELVTERCKQEDRIQKTIRDASSWLEDHEEYTNVSNVRTVYLILVRDKGFLQTEDIARALREAESWMLKHGSNPIFKDYLALLKKVRKSSLDIETNSTLVKEVGYKSMSSLDMANNAEQIADFAAWLNYEHCSEESAKIYDSLLSTGRLRLGTEKLVYFGYGMLFIGQAFDTELTARERQIKLVNAEENFRKVLNI